jgi:hypothetical protein
VWQAPSVFSHSDPAPSSSLRPRPLQPC